MNINVTLGLASLALVSLASSCTSAPADVSGVWSVNLTNGANGCMVSGWTAGETAAGVPMTITQSGSTVTAEVGGPAAVLLNVALGTSRLTGVVNGSTVDLHADGRPGAEGACAFTSQLDITLRVTGDTLTGTTSWSYNANVSPDCGYRATCDSVQALNGARPPR